MALKDPEACKAYRRAYYNRNSEAYKWRNIKNTFGLSKEDYLNILVEQDNKCKLCEKPFQGLNGRDVHVDHCHETNKVRGILCMPCNVALGMLGDNEEGLTRALNYVKGKI